MRSRMGRMTKRNRTKYRRRAYEAGMLAKTVASPTTPPQSGRSIDRTPPEFGGKRAA